MQMLRGRGGANMQMLWGRGGGGAFIFNGHCKVTGSCVYTCI